MNIILYHDTVIPRQPQRSPPALDVEGQPSPLTPADAPRPVNAWPCHYAMACTLGKREGTDTMTTNQSILYKFEGFILHPLVHLSTYSG